MATPFTPKQAIPFRGDLLDELQGRVSIDVAIKVLPMLPPLTSSSVLHDNGCGTGAVTEAAMLTNPPAGFQVQATDVAPMFLDTYKERAAREKWPATTSQQDSQDLAQIADESITHSIASFVFMILKDDAKAAAEIRRTLTSAGGGTAAIVLWKHTPHMPALKEASKTVRGPDSEVPPMLGAEDYKGEQVRKALVAGGFDESKIEHKEVVVEMPLKDAKRWAELAWSFLGAPPGGWTQKDEEQWDQAIAQIVTNMRTMDGCRAVGEHGAAITMTADVSIATK